MDTKTAKQEALALLALAELTLEQQQQLNILTAKQVGYRVRTEKERVQGHTVYALLKPDGTIHQRAAYADEVYIWDASPGYCTSVDACLTLPLPGGYYWKLKSAVSGVPESGNEASIFNIHRPRDLLISMAYVRTFRTLPIAMLWFRWQMQPD